MPPVKPIQVAETGSSQALALLLVVALSVTPLACGEDAPGGDIPSGTRTSARTSATVAREVPDPTPEPTDGRLTTSDGRIITDYGPRRDRLAAVRALEQLQRDFRAGDMAAACTRISDFLLSQFTPGTTQGDTPCPDKLDAYAAQRTRRGDQARRLELLWVRAYTAEAGVWVDDGRGDRIRIQMTSQADGSWQLDLGALNRPDLLASELVGATVYGDR